MKLIKPFIKPVLIAEIGCNHQGSMGTAKQLIESAAQNGASYAKFQKRNNKYLLGKLYDKPHPVPENSFGTSYGKHREYLEFGIKEHEYLYQLCKKNKIKYATSVWEIKSAQEILNSKIKLDYIKVPSACNLDFELLNFLTKKFKGKIHLSSGMTTENELKKIIKFFIKKRRNKDLILYLCTSSYPCKATDVCLLDLVKFKKQYGNIVGDIAFSGHHMGISIDIAAYTLGAKYIERHFTIDRAWKGTDQSASLEPQGLNKLCRDLNNTFLSLTSKNGKLLNSEKKQRIKLKSLKNARI
ncbi:N-acetylneuraminate synthase family protein [Pelagibacteraceae bacterium]|nr:N-acetylneuraminate synthase family protein [Pelagibacteraceae bacterium]